MRTLANYDITTIWLDAGEYASFCVKVVVADY